MRWEESVFALFEDLEMQAEGLYLEQRAAEVESLTEAGYAEVELAARIHASAGARLRVGLVEGTEIRGRLARAGKGWILLDAGSSEWLVRLEGVAVLEGLDAAAMVPELLPLVARLSVHSALRRLVGAGGPCVCWLAGQRQVAGRISRVGADFVEMLSAGSRVLVPTRAVIAVQGAR